MTELDRHYGDPRLATLYDLENPRGADTAYWVRLAADLDARTIIDLGCGTGLVTCELAVEGRRVIGVDPSEAMLAIARRRPNAKAVHWIEGDASALGTPEADLVLMTGNVAQVFLDDREWTASLRSIRNALRPGGRLAFESRNPDDQAWRRWNRERTHHRIDSPSGPVEAWLELLRVRNGRVGFEHHYVFTATGEVVVATSEIRFRDLGEVTRSLVETGFFVERVNGDWDGEPFDGSGRVMVFLARRS